MADPKGDMGSGPLPLENHKCYIGFYRESIRIPLEKDPFDFFLVLTKIEN